MNTRLGDNGPERITLAMTGASGAQYGLRLLDCLVREDREVHFLISKAAQLVIATGACNNLIERAADVTLKERRQLILVPREAPYSSIHLEHMLKLSNMGVTILPASPGFYHQPQTIDDLIDFVVARILNLLNIPQDMLPRWGEHHLSSDE